MQANFRLIITKEERSCNESVILPTRRTQQLWSSMHEISSGIDTETTYLMLGSYTFVLLFYRLPLPCLSIRSRKNPWGYKG